MAEKNLVFTENLKQAISDTKLSNPKFAKKAGMNYSTLMTYLRPENNGRVAEWDQLVKISKASGKSIEWLLTGKENNITPDITASWSEELKNLCLDLKEILETADEVSIAALKMNMAMIKGAVKDRNEKVGLNKRIKVLEKEVKDLKVREPHGCAEASGDYLPAAGKKGT